MIILSVLTWRRFTDVILPPVARSWSRLMLRVIGIRLETEGAELLRQREPRIVVFNHESALDILWLARLFPPAATGIVKREFLYVPFLNLALWSAGFVFINRKNRQRALATLDNLTDVIRRDARSLLISPEGTRTRTGAMLPFKKGAFRIAMKGGINVFPVVVAGAYDLLPKSKLLPKRGTIKVKCLPPISTADWNASNLDSKVDEIRQKMLLAREEL